LADAVHIRPARADDAGWILELVPRLHEFGPPPWRTVEQMNAGERADLTQALSSLTDTSNDTSNDPASVFLVAEQGASGVPIGFLYAATLIDFFTGEPHAHIKDVVISAAGEGQGAARRLMEAAEAWTRERGYRFITLSVFPENRRALQLYQRSGYSTDVLRMLKMV
jgi:ribosomal protein S18 acetylase RimI-like enzyme